jgi:hypothetical protein
VLGRGENPLMLGGRGVQLLNGVTSISNYAYSLSCVFFSGSHDARVGPADTDRFSRGKGVIRGR